jgi:hypothetical protein
MPQILRRVVGQCLTVALVLGSAAPAYAERSVCDTPHVKQRVSTLLSTQSSTLGDRGFAAAVAASNVVLVGEEHFYSDPTRYADVLSGFAKAKGSGACVGLELSDYRMHPQRMVDGYGQIAKAMRESAVKMGTPADMVIKLAKGAERSAQTNRWFTAILKAAGDAGLRPVTIDKNGHNIQKAYTVAERNEAMAANIAYYLTAGCSSLLFIVGRSHIRSVRFADQNTDGTERAVPSHLAAMNIRPVTINMVAVSEPRPFAERSFTCEMPTFTRSQFVRTAEFFATDNEMNPAVLQGLLFSAFDYTILIP